MTDTDTTDTEVTPEAPETPTETPQETPQIIGEGETTAEPDDDATAPPMDEKDIAKLHREAAARRRELREAQGTIETLNERLAATQRQIVGLVADTRRVDMSLLDAAGHELASFVTDDGTVDVERIVAACEETAKRYNISRSRVRPSQQQGRPSPSPSGTTWAEALRGR